MNLWLCPTCGHGSPDVRDELPHLDAHRRLLAAKVVRGTGRSVFCVHGQRQPHYAGGHAVTCVGPFVRTWDDDANNPLDKMRALGHAD